MPPKEQLEPVLKLLCVCMVFFTAILFASEIWFNSDSQLFQVIAGILTGIVGAFLGRIKPAAKGDTGPPGASVFPPVADGAASVTSVTSITTPAEKKPD